jgi:hypothetical protein
MKFLYFKAGRLTLLNMSFIPYLQKKNAIENSTRMLAWYSDKKETLRFHAAWWKRSAYRMDVHLTVSPDYVPVSSTVEFVKRLPLFPYPLAWNLAPGDKLKPRKQFYSKNLKKILLSNIK